MTNILWITMIKIIVKLILISHFAWNIKLQKLKIILKQKSKLT